MILYFSICTQKMKFSIKYFLQTNNAIIVFLFREKQKTVTLLILTTIWLQLIKDFGEVLNFFYPLQENLMRNLHWWMMHFTKMKFSSKHFFSKFDQIRRKQFCAVMIRSKHIVGSVYIQFFLAHFSPYSDWIRKENSMDWFQYNRDLHHEKVKLFFFPELWKSFKYQNLTILIHNPTKFLTQFWFQKQYQNNTNIRIQTIPLEITIFLPDLIMPVCRKYDEVWRLKPSKAEPEYWHSNQNIKWYLRYKSIFCHKVALDV